MCDATKLKQMCDRFIEKFISKVSVDMDIPIGELLDIYKGISTKESSSKGDSKKSSSSSSSKLDDVCCDVTIEAVLKATCPELKSMCKMKGLKCSGNKADLIQRLRDCLNGDTKESDKPRNSGVSTTSKTSKKKSSKNDSKTKVYSEVIEPKINFISIRKNGFGNLEHPPTGLIYSEASKEIIGKQEEDGRISELTDDDIENCKKYKLQFKIPFNLDNETMDSVKLADIEDDEDEDIDNLIKVKEDIDDDEEDEDISDEDEDII